MNIPFYHINSFVYNFGLGNPAGVCILDNWISTDGLQQIAIENALPVTAFIVKKLENYQIKWFTPQYELELCGHGTLAAAYVIVNFLDPNLKKIHFETEHINFTADCIDDWLTLEFPIKHIEFCAVPKLLEQALDRTILEVYRNLNDRLLVVLNHEDDIINLKPDILLLREIGYQGVIFTAEGKEVDFVSRTFYPRKIIHEDFVTGFSHCILAPFWAKKLGKNPLEAIQLSSRRGYLKCQVVSEKVRLSGMANLYMIGEIKYISSHVTTLG